MLYLHTMLKHVLLIHILQVVVIVQSIVHITMKDTIIAQGMLRYIHIYAMVQVHRHPAGPDLMAGLYAVTDIHFM